MASILIISFSNIAFDPRVSRQIEALSGIYDVSVCGYGPAPPDVVRYWDASPPARSPGARAASLLPLSFAMYERYYWSHPRVRRAGAVMGSSIFDLVIANDLGTLPLALQVAAGRPVIFDAHEFAPLEYEDRFLWRFFMRAYTLELCRRYVSQAALVTTVCESIAARFRGNFGVRTEVITNAGRFREVAVRSTHPARIRMVHHGVAIVSRHLACMIELVERLDERFSLDFAIVPGSESYIRALKRRANGNRRIRFLEPVPMDKLVALSSEYDVGLFLLPPANFNYRVALPNKFFEFIQARLALAIGPSPEMARIVNEFGCGVVAEDFTPAALAQKLNALGAADFDRMKSGSVAAARVHHAGAGAERLQALAAEMLARGGR